jgi:hypothetical protein
MACDRCISAMRNTLVIGSPVECQCDYCGARFLAGKPDLCVSCYWYWSDKTDEGYRYGCHKERHKRKGDKCTRYKKEVT